MAGIAGIHGGREDAGTLDRMIKAMRHRGPDTLREGNTKKTKLGVCGSRLSVARGDGYAADGDVRVVFDGEIYNSRGHGVSDAEVALDLYLRHGSVFPGYLEGVFACAISRGENILLARDSVGVRPLYYGFTSSGDLCFASELKALTGVAETVMELHPGTVYTTAAGVAEYLPRFPEVAIPANVEEAASRLRECLLSAVERRLQDGAVGVCLLSGGLDSSIIAAAAKELGATDLTLVTVGVEGAKDLENAAIMAKHLDMKHRVHLFTAEDIKEAVPRAVRALESFDEDCVSGAISNLFASSVAKEFTNCILSGEGGDELFGGYHLLKELPTQQERLDMMKRLISIAYNTAVQRLDRAMMGNGINYRTPFIDTEVIAYASQLPVSWKVHDAGGGRLIEKWVLREAFKDLLPEEIYRRDKLRFAAGTGTDDLMDRIAIDEVSEGEFTEASRNTPAGYRLHSLKELWYYRIFKEEFPSAAFESMVGRWDPSK